jgi:hypothetical protein
MKNELQEVASDQATIIPQYSVVLKGLLLLNQGMSMDQ